MFDIGFWELILIGIMGLVVLGPERLPVAIRTVRGWITGARNFSDTVKSAASVKSLQEAAAMVNEPFKKVDKSALDSLISTSLATSVSHQSVTTNSSNTQQQKNIQAELLDTPQVDIESTEHEVKKDK
jgi:sec-independent protein translocase protein TatB